MDLLLGDFVGLTLSCLAVVGEVYAEHRMFGKI